MWKPARVVSANFLERVADPASRFYLDYRAFRKREISQADVIARLPHVALIGDSVCTGVYISSVWSTFWRARTCSGNNWFLDTGPAAAGAQWRWKLPAYCSPFLGRACAGIRALLHP